MFVGSQGTEGHDHDLVWSLNKGAASDYSSSGTDTGSSSTKRVTGQIDSVELNIENRGEIGQWGIYVFVFHQYFR